MARRPGLVAAGERALPARLPYDRMKGNIGNSGERIYHVPGGDYYDAPRISMPKGERWFCGEARAAGRRKSRR